MSRRGIEEVLKVLFWNFTKAKIKFEIEREKKKEIKKIIKRQITINF